MPLPFIPHSNSLPMPTLFATTAAVLCSTPPLSATTYSFLKIIRLVMVYGGRLCCFECSEIYFFKTKYILLIKTQNPEATLYNGGIRQDYKESSIHATLPTFLLTISPVDSIHSPV
ncbi:uncharacterized protein LOC141614822 [Silene latifolia]|uniref:uncharacterized protein LOC141614822 n=1 Tax=Silene latifolia TaxID=37657 RepID=UPI003D771988